MLQCSKRYLTTCCSTEGDTSAHVALQKERLDHMLQYHQEDIGLCLLYAHSSTDYEHDDMVTTDCMQPSSRV